ncbi:MAG TPA: cupin domain-containing protein [Chloroflexota bacterium]|nr:cupin domain-containing protein [Chloroflexota bacterium]
MVDVPLLGIAFERVVAGDSLAARSQSGDDIVAVHAGRAEFDLGDGRVEVAGAGAILVIGPDGRHRIRSVSEKALLLLRVSASPV